MNWRIVGGGFIGVLLCVAGRLATAEEPPSITNLPKDLAHLATAWVAVPQAMYQVSRDAGPMQGLTVGTVEGSERMVRRTVTYLTSGYFDHSPADEDETRPLGALVHYSF